MQIDRVTIYLCCELDGRLVSQGRNLVSERASRSLYLLSSVNSSARNWARPDLS